MSKDLLTSENNSYMTKNSDWPSHKQDNINLPNNEHTFYICHKNTPNLNLFIDLFYNICMTHKHKIDSEITGWDDGLIASMKAVPKVDERYLNDAEAIRFISILNKLFPNFTNLNAKKLLFPKFDDLNEIRRLRLVGISISKCMYTCNQIEETNLYVYK
ncbi:hypothetical protein COBT_002412, partial [Conglomerata obtusa]